MNDHHEKCDICGAAAWLEKYPSGSVCEAKGCGIWVCDNCTDYDYMNHLHRQTGEEYADAICIECAQEGRTY